MSPSWLVEIWFLDTKKQSRGRCLKHPQVQTLPRALYLRVHTLTPEELLFNSLLEFSWSATTEVGLRLRLGYFIYHVLKCRVCCSKILIENRCYFVQAGNFQKVPDVTTTSDRRLTLMTVGQTRTDVKFWWQRIRSGGEGLCFIRQDDNGFLYCASAVVTILPALDVVLTLNFSHPTSHLVPIIPARWKFQSLEGGICTVFSCHWFSSYYDIFGIEMEMHIQFQQAVCSTDGWVDASLHCAPLRLVRYQQQTDVHRCTNTGRQQWRYGLN